MIIGDRDFLRLNNEPVHDSSQRSSCRRWIRRPLTPGGSAPTLTDRRRAKEIIAVFTLIRMDRRLQYRFSYSQHRGARPKKNQTNRENVVNRRVIADKKKSISKSKSRDDDHEKQNT